MTRNDGTVAINAMETKIKALTALEGRLSLSVGWKTGPERGLKTVTFNP